MLTNTLPSNDLSNYFPIPNSGFEFHATAQDSQLFFVERGTGPGTALGIKQYRRWDIPEFTARYLKECDGFQTHSQIVKRVFSANQSILTGIYLRKALAALNQETGVLSFERSPRASAMLNTGSFDSFAPLHTSIEITDTCNFLCDHCYVSAAPWKTARRERDDLLSLLDLLRENGVKVLELTGGECTTHPGFKDVLAKASANFHLVAIISNGWLIGRRGDLADFISQHANVAVQISVDGMESFHDSFRKKRGAFREACRAITALRKRGVGVRMAMTVTWQNLDQVVPVFHLAKSLNVSALSVAPTTSFGRAGASQLVGSCSEDEHKLFHEIQKALAPFSGDPLFDANRISIQDSADQGEINCGAGWRSFAINGATGEVRSCLFLADSKKFGSLDSEDYSDLFRSPYMKMFKNAPSPSPDLATCRDCRYVGTCSGCFAKAFEIARKNFPNGLCPWRAAYFPGMSLAEGESKLHELE